MIRHLVSTLIVGCAAATGAAAPTAEWTSTTYDFGAFSEDSGPQTARFELINTGDAPLSIVSGRATCGCTTPDYPRESIAPGDTAIVKVTYNPDGRPGRFAKKVYIETTGEPAHTTLTVRGTVIGSARTIGRRYPVDMGPLRASQRTLIIGEVYKNRFKSVFFDCYNISADSLRVQVTRKPEWLDITVAPETASPGEQVTLVAYANSANCPLYGLVEDSVTIVPAPGTEYTLPVTMTVNEDFSALTPSQTAKAPVALLSDTALDAGTVARDGGALTLSFGITNAGRDPLKIRRIYSADSGVGISVVGADTIKPGKRATVRVTADPAAAAGDMLNARISVITNDPVHPVQTVRITALLK